MWRLSGATRAFSRSIPFAAIRGMEQQSRDGLHNEVFYPYYNIDIVEKKVNF